ncbi:hypothetical protein V1511DRAFT_495641 [Dipodascopsis uninucleata]
MATRSARYYAFIGGLSCFSLLMITLITIQISSFHEVAARSQSPADDVVVKALNLKDFVDNIKTEISGYKQFYFQQLPIEHEPVNPEGSEELAYELEKGYYANDEDDDAVYDIDDEGPTEYEKYKFSEDANFSETRAINVDIVCTSAADFDIVLSLAGSLLLPPSSMQERFIDLDLFEGEIPIQDGINRRVNLTIVNASPETSKENDFSYGNYDRMIDLVLREIKHLPINIIRSESYSRSVSSPKLIFLASCLDDSISLGESIRHALANGAKVKCIVRDPAAWDITEFGTIAQSAGQDVRKAIELARPHIEDGNWNFISTTKNSIDYIRVLFPVIFGVSSSIDIVEYHHFIPLIPRTTLQKSAIKKKFTGSTSALIGADFVRPLSYKQKLYKKAIEMYGDDRRPSMTLHILDFLGGAGKYEQYELPATVPFGSIIIEHNLPFHTFVKHASEADILIPSVTIPQSYFDRRMIIRQIDLSVMFSLSLGRPLLMKRSLYESYFVSRIPIEIVIFSDDHDGFYHARTGETEVALRNAAEWSEIAYEQNWLFISTLLDKISRS